MKCSVNRGATGMARAGLLRDRVTFQRLDAGSDEYGNEYNNWSDLATRSAELTEKTGQRQVEGGALQDVARATLLCRSDSTTAAITAADRVIARGITWSIQTATQADAKGEMREFVLEKGVAS